MVRDRVRDRVRARDMRGVNHYMRRACHYVRGAYHCGTIPLRMPLRWPETRVTIAQCTWHVHVDCTCHVHAQVTIAQRRSQFRLNMGFD